MESRQDSIERFIERLPLGIIILNADLHIEMRNDLSLKLLDVGVENLLNTDFLDIMKGQTGLKDCILQIHSGICHQQHVVLTITDKTLSCTVFNAGDTEAGGLIVLIEDATNLSKVEQIKREFIGTLLHKIRGPLATMKTSLSILDFETGLSGSHLPIEVQEVISMCRSEVSRLSLLVNDMRDLFLIETNIADKDLVYEDFTVDSVIKGVIADLKKSLSPMPVDTRISLTGNAGLLLYADYEKTKKIFFVLLKNALQYSAPDTPVTVSCSAAEKSINIIIKDRGIGIAESLTNQVFSKYFREDNFTTRNNAGNGLGLFIAKSYVDMMKGTMYFDSKQGEGTSFYLAFHRAAGNDHG
jgi:two-component system, OmpR family, phosphate regulon sensor histidine kinase PhoR